MRTRMHDDEILSTSELARALLADTPWVDRPLRLVDSFGTDHDVYRLGDDLSLRLPRTAWAGRQADLERTWLPRVAAVLPVAVPRVLHVGAPTPEFPHPWSVQTWVAGRDASAVVLDDGARLALADDLAATVLALRTMPHAEAPERAATARGGDLAVHDETVTRALHELGDRVDGVRLERAWQQARRAAPHEGPRTWSHADLLPANLLLGDVGRLTGVIDWGGLGLVDPALDLLPLWHLLPGEAGRRYADALGADEDARLRGRGWAVLQAVQALPYYWRTNPGIVRQSHAAVRAIAAEIG